MTILDETPPIPQLPRDARTYWEKIRRYWEKVAVIIGVLGLADLFHDIVQWAAAIHLVIAKYHAIKVWLFGWLPFHIPPQLHDIIILSLVLFSVTNVGFYKRTGRSILVYWILSCLGFVIVPGLWIPANFSRSAESLRQKWIRHRDFAKLYRQKSDDTIEKYLSTKTERWVDFTSNIYAAIVIIPIVLVVLNKLHIWPFYMLNLSPESVERFLSTPTTSPPSAMLLIGYIIFLLFFVAFYCLVILRFLSKLGILIAWRWILTTVACFIALVMINDFYVFVLEPMAKP